MSELVATANDRRVAWLDQATRQLEDNPDLDRVAGVVEKVSRPFNQGDLADFLRGSWLGHAFHPVLTDIPIGFWMGSILLDFLPGGHKSSRRLLGAGLAAVPLTAAAGLAEWDALQSPGQRRVTAVHAIGNTLAAAAFTRSFVKRGGNSRRTGGMLWSLVGGSIVLATAYLGGHLSYARQVGTGPRGRPSPVPVRSDPIPV